MTVSYSYADNGVTDQGLDLVQVKVSGTYDAAVTSVTLEAGEGAKLPAVLTTNSLSFDLIWWDSDFTSVFNDPNAEKIRVTNRTIDTLTIVRGQGNTSASTKNSTSTNGYVMSLVLSWEMIEDMARALPGEVTMRRFGADNTGGTNASAGIKAAIAACVTSGKPLFLGKGTYLIDEIDFTGVNEIRGVAGLTILKQRILGPNMMSFDQHSGSCKITDIIIQGIAGTDSVSDNNGIEIKSTAASPSIGDNGDFIIENCTFKNCRFNAVDAHFCSSLKVSNCEVDACSDGIRFRSCTNVDVVYNRINASQVAENSAQLVATISSNMQSGLSTAENNKHVNISHNHITGRSAGQSILVHSGEWITVQNNTIEGALTGIAVAPAANIAEHRTTHVIVSGNVIECVTTTTAPELSNFCITVSGANSPNPGLDYVVVSDNICVNGNRAKNQSGMGGIGFQSNIHRGVISGNVVYQARGAAVIFAGVCDDVAVTGNSFVDTIAGTDGEFGIKTQTDVVLTGICTGNTFVDLAVGIQSDNDASGFEVGHNKFDTVTTKMVLGGGGDTLGMDMSIWGGDLRVEEGDLVTVGGAWNTSHLVIGTAHFWMNGNDLRGASGPPTSGTSGTSIGIVSIP